MTIHKRSFVKGAAILAMAGILVKVIGILYRIPLFNILQAEGQGLYMTAYPYYTLLLTLSTAGLPPAISKMVASRVTLGDDAGARKVFRVSLFMMTTLGLLFSIVLYSLSYQIADMLGDPLVARSIAFISPAIFFVAIMSSIRGYFQGLQNMVPTALSQLFEQVAKIIFGLYFALKWSYLGIEYAASGAIFGVVLSEIIALAFITIYYFAKAPKIHKHKKSHESSLSILKQLTKLALPILLGACIMPIVAQTDASLIRLRLIDIGYTLPNARAMLGLFTGTVNTIVNVPGSISLAICVAMVPAISSAVARKSSREITRNIRLGYKLALLVGIPSAIGLGVLAYPILDLLYGYKTPVEQIILSSNLLIIIAGGVIFLSILQTFNGVLQGLGKVFVPVIALASGAIVKIVIEYILLGIESVNIYGAPISTFACYAVAATIDIIMIRKLTNIRLNEGNPLIRISLASILMGSVAWASHSLLTSMIGSKPATIIAVLLGIITYIIGIIIFNALSREEWKGLPGGHRFLRLYDKLRRN